jgi:preprotein translocase subunit SecB
MGKVVQEEIKLIAFKAVTVHFTTIAQPTEEQSKQEFQFRLSDLKVSDKPRWFVKVFSIRLNIPSGFGPEIVICEVEYHTVFERNIDIDDSFLSSDFARISAPAIGFPYVRAFISTISMQAGMFPVILPSINFVQFSKEAEVKP